MKRLPITDPRVLAGYRKPRQTVSTGDRMKQKLRTCLSCQVEFESEWCGERVCKKCKSTTIYR